MIGKTIKDLRAKKNVTQEELGKVIGLTTSMIGMYETDARNPSLDVLTKLANYFNVSTDFLLGREFNEGLVIKVEREAQGISAKELGQALGIDEFEILQYESNKALISQPMMDKIEKVFGLSFFDLMKKHSFSYEQIPIYFDGDVDAHEQLKKAEDWTEDELGDIEKFKDFLLSKRNNKN